MIFGGVAFPEKKERFIFTRQEQYNLSWDEMKMLEDLLTGDYRPYLIQAWHEEPSGTNLIDVTYPIPVITTLV